MKRTSIPFFIATTILLSLIFSSGLKAQGKAYVMKDAELYRTIAHMDSVCFDAFNARDLKTLSHVFAENVEFYNDGGKVTNYQQTMESFKKMFASNAASPLKRTLVGSIEVYPLKDFGAIEVGVHQFTHVENGKEEIGIFKFVQVWELKNGAWKMTRVISYDH
ncbi:protein of unknown function [Pedobacter steynii]|uniref:DUF4440 domain-containing protein n=1 Tax=Pedobacter steynii TaxID=430522 RepID=A0A1H0B769_9SPHI|nr:nuclear transport factor 2 family protein [Pedobacter steynii]NQX41136.1 nuclear transport factor 2 family protein [Pedobacter steynii]SDN41489.1 protein of unknown function [Pedobacter steynii]